jgi:hypothetical protein
MEQNVELCEEEKLEQALKKKKARQHNYYLKHKADILAKQKQFRENKKKKEAELNMEKFDSLFKVL